MKLLRLRVRGLRSFARETEIDLERLGEEGLFAIFGPTGAGKSTILDGIFLALFGRCPRGEAGECVSVGALELSVRLELSLDREDLPRPIAVERRFRWGKKRDAAAPEGAIARGAPRHPPLRIEERKEGAWTAVDLGGVKPDDYLRDQIVRVSMSDFQQAVVLPQGEFDALLRARPAERRTLVASLFRTEHLGAPLIDALRAREIKVRSEMGRLDEAEREVLVSSEDAAAAAALADSAKAEAEAGEAALARAEQAALGLRIARQRCAARDATAAALAEVERDLEARADDRSRVERGRRAAGAEEAVTELGRGEEAALETDARATAAAAEARAAAVGLRALAKAFAEATEARAAELPGVMERLGRARLALERGRDLARLEADRQARARERDAAAEVLVAARSKARAAAAAQREAEDGEREAAARLEAAKVGEDERAEATARVAEAEARAAEERLARVAEGEQLAAEARVVELEDALAAVEETAGAAEVEAERRRVERARAEVDAQRAAAEVEQAEHALDAARRAAAAAELAADLRAGEACPVCGASEHPGADHRTASLAVGLAERAREAARRIVRAAERTLADAAREAAAGDEELRAIAARGEAVAASLDEARLRLARLRSGEEIPRALEGARREVERLRARADLALGALDASARAAVLAEAEPLAPAEARVTALGQRAREAEQLARARAAAEARAGETRTAAHARAAELERAERACASAQERLATAASLAGARREEIHALLVEVEPRGQRGLFEVARPEGPEAWIARLEAAQLALTGREDQARAALDEARAAEGRLALEAREASALRDEAKARLSRARAAARTAVARAGFDGPDAVRRALLDPAVLAAMASDLDRLERERERLRAVHAERERDVSVEVSEAEAAAAERARDDARRAALDAGERAAQTAEHRDELTRRRHRALEIRAKIALLEPRARRLAQIRQVVSSNQLSELAAERHLEAVTRGAAALLRSLSGDRYSLVRTEGGAFAVADAAHGDLVRPPSTLSGGETFLVSLALALALSERIQLAGRTRFDFFFLDEGFGSLDAVTLEVALTALERLRGPHRVIGMISHVAAIEERMPRKLRVQPGRPGGHAIVIHEAGFGEGPLPT